MTDDAQPLAWRASAGRVAGVGWLAGALGGATTVVSFGLAGWGASSEAGVAGDPWSVVAGLLVGALMGVPVGGTGGLWAAAIVVAIRGSAPSRRRGTRMLRAGVAAAVVGAVVVLIAAFDVSGLLFRVGGPVPHGVTVVLGALATAGVVMVACRVVPREPDGAEVADGDPVAAPAAAGATAAPTAAAPTAAAPTAAGTTPLVREPFLLGAVLGPLALNAAPALALLAGPAVPAPLMSSGEGFLVLLGIVVGPLVGLVFALVVAWPWEGSGDPPGDPAARVAVVVTLQLAAATLLALLAFALLGGEPRSAGASVGGGVVILAVQLVLLVAAWRSHARHAADLNHSR